MKIKKRKSQPDILIMSYKVIKIKTVWYFFRKRHQINNKKVGIDPFSI